MLAGGSTKVEQRGGATFARQDFVAFNADSPGDVLSMAPSFDRQVFAVEGSGDAIYGTALSSGKCGGSVCGVAYSRGDQEDRHG